MSARAPERLLSRRALLAHAAAAGGAGVLSGGSFARESFAAMPAPQGGASDADILRGAIEVENLAVLSYSEVLRAGQLTQRDEHTARRLLSFERAHLAALTRELAALGAQPPPRPKGIARGDALLATHHITGRLSDLHTRHDCLRLLLEVEQLSVGTYYEAMSKLQSPALLRRGAEIMASEAQHAMTLSQLEAPSDIARAVPTPFVHGKS